MQQYVRNSPLDCVTFAEKSSAELRTGVPARPAIAASMWLIRFNLPGSTKSQYNPFSRGRVLIYSSRLSALDEWEHAFSANGRKVTRLRVSHAFHSELMDPMLEELKTIVEQAVLASGAQSPKEMGLAMKSAMSAVDGRADGRRVSGLVKAALGG